MIWLDAHLSPRLATWLQDSMGHKAQALRDLDLRHAEDEEILIPYEQSPYRNDGFLRLGEIVSEAEIEGTPNDWILAVLRVSHIARYAPSLRLATIQSFDVIPAI